MMPMQVLLLEKIPWLWKATRREFSFICAAIDTVNVTKSKWQQTRIKIVSLKLKDAHHQDFFVTVFVSSR